jgi:hypothetical protein
MNHKLTEDLNVALDDEIIGDFSSGTDSVSESDYTQYVIQGIHDFYEKVCVAKY